ENLTKVEFIEQESSNNEESHEKEEDITITEDVVGQRYVEREVKLAEEIQELERELENLTKVEFLEQVSPKNEQSHKKEEAITITEDVVGQRYVEREVKLAEEIQDLVREFENLTKVEFIEQESSNNEESHEKEEAITIT